MKNKNIYVIFKVYFLVMSECLCFACGKTCAAASFCFCCNEQCHNSYINKLAIKAKITLRLAKNAVNFSLLHELPSTPAAIARYLTSQSDIILETYRYNVRQSTIKIPVISSNLKGEGGFIPDYGVTAPS